jgi:putative oxidoreductase
MLLGARDWKKDAGLLLMRLGIAAVLLWHSVPKLIGGAPAWKSLGTTLAFINVGLPASFLGLLSLSFEAACSISLIVGYFFRLSSAVLFLLLLLYSINYFNVAYKTLMMWSLALTGVFLGLVFTGPGRYSLAAKLHRR